MRTLFEQESGRNLSLRTALAGGIILIAVGFALGFTAGAGAEGKGGPLGTLVAPPGVDFSPVWKAWYIIDEKFVPAAVATSTQLASSTELPAEDNKVSA